MRERILRVSFRVAVALAMALPAGAAENGPVVPVTGGQVRGRPMPEGSGAVFKGIPFAQPPIGDLRWREPQAVAAWTGIRDAGESGPPCTQASAGWNAKEAARSREDCLYLDVWTSEWPPKTSKPVMVWFHGGGNTGGAAGSDPLYNGTEITKHGVVLVIPEYRLGVFGFFAHPELTRKSPHHSSGNYGIEDQIAALRWVHDNIARFGGSPENVTIFGQSAGSMDLSALMTSPLTEGLFHRAIAESGAVPMGSRTMTLARAEMLGVRIAGALKAPAEGALPYLRSLKADELVKLRAAPSGINVDGWVFAAAPASVFAAGKEHRVPLIAGSNAIEMLAPGSLEALRRTIEERYGAQAPKVLSLYGLAAQSDKGKQDPLYGGPADQWAADTEFRCPTVLMGLWHSAAGNPTWEYQFDRAIPPNPATAHSSELPYVFGNLWDWGSKAGNYGDTDRKLSAMIRAFWTNFARAGDPNGSELPQWPAFDGKTRKYLEFTKAGGTSVGENERGAFCEAFIEGVRASMGGPSGEVK